MVRRRGGNAKVRERRYIAGLNALMIKLTPTEWGVGYVLHRNHATCCQNAMLRVLRLQDECAVIHSEKQEATRYFGRVAGQVGQLVSWYQVPSRTGNSGVGERSGQPNQRYQHLDSVGKCIWHRARSERFTLIVVVLDFICVSSPRAPTPWSSMSSCERTPDPVEGLGWFSGLALRLATNRSPRAQARSERGAKPNRRSERATSSV
ncbi:hypothetical protein F4808DRAFT_25935 [Astrocystis sublimbata]|nr:hypothetical protein F4808DRAFT_25935 [Astrocystis sublimbata]